MSKATQSFSRSSCVPNRDNETPQQFLYRAIGLKQKILLASKHADTDVKYSPSTVQDILIHTMYQGLGYKHNDVHRELKPFLADPCVIDEAILWKMRKIISDENERHERPCNISAEYGGNVRTTSVGHDSIGTESPMWLIQLQPPLQQLKFPAFYEICSTAVTCFLKGHFRKQSLIFTFRNKLSCLIYANWWHEADWGGLSLWFNFIISICYSPGHFNTFADKLSLSTFVQSTPTMGLNHPLQISFSCHPL